MRLLAAASSMRSMALSGRRLAGMYRLDSSAAAVNAGSVMVTWWWFS